MSRLWTKPDHSSLKEMTILVAVDPSWLEPALASFRAAGGAPMVVNTVEEAVHFLQFQQPEFFLISDGFGANEKHPNPLLEYIQRMPTGPRREIFVILIGQNLKTGDHLSAFSYSVNLVIHPDKLQDLVAQINESWPVWKDVYQVFIQTRLQLLGH